MEKNTKSEIQLEQWRPSPISISLMYISQMMANGVNFIILRETLEKWVKEAKEGNKDSEKLIEMVLQFEKLLKVVLKGRD